MLGSGFTTLILSFINGGEVEDTTFETKPKHSKKIRAQGPTLCGQIISRPRTGMVEAKAKDRAHDFSKLRSAKFSNIFKLESL